MVPRAGSEPFDPGSARFSLVSQFSPTVLSRAKQNGHTRRSHVCLPIYSDRNSHHHTTGSRLSSCLTGTSRFYALTKSMESKIACVILIVIGFCLFTLCLFLAGCKIRLIESVIEAYTRSSEEETKPKTVFIEETAI